MPQMGNTLIGMGFSDMYLVENPAECCYKERSESLKLMEFDQALYGEIRSFYQHLIARSGDHQASISMFWPVAHPGKRVEQMRLRVTNLVDASGKTVFYIRRYRQGVANLSQLGVPKPIIDRLLSGQLTQGLLILAGKAGSGKTTLANSVICSRLERWGGVCVTAENPVELEISGRHGGGMCFAHEVESDDEMATAVINFMRTAPNVIFLGEIRDAVVAREAVLAALSGHLVITTFHGPSIVGALSRFAGFIGDNNLLADALSAVAFLELCENKDQTSLFNLKHQVANVDEGSRVRADAKKLTIDLLWFLGAEGVALSSMVRSGNFAMLSSELSRQRNQMLQTRA